MSDVAGTRYTGPIGALRDDPWLSALDIPHDRETIVCIEALMVHKGVEFVSEGRKDVKSGGSLKFRGAVKKLFLNATNMKTLAALFGNHSAAMEGKWIALFVDPNVRGKAGKVGPAVRIRARHVEASEIPKPRADAAVVPKTEPAPETK